MEIYEEIKEGYWVYSIKIKSNGKYYIGISKQQISKRWQKSAYKHTALESYLTEWEDMEKTVLINGLNTKREALIIEDNIIRALSNNNLCINKQRSGLITNDLNAYMKQLKKNNPEYHERTKQSKKQWYDNNKEKVHEYDKKYRENNKERIKEYNKLYREDNKEKIREYKREWQKQNRLKKKLKKQYHTSVL